MNIIITSIIIVLIIILISPAIIYYLITGKVNIDGIKKIYTILFKN